MDCDFVHDTYVHALKKKCRFHNVQSFEGQTEENFQHLNKREVLKRKKKTYFEQLQERESSSASSDDPRAALADATDNSRDV